MDDTDLDLGTKLNFETGRITWPELQRHFARGVVLVVEADLDLIKVAETLAQDDSTTVERWIQQKSVAGATMEQARIWEDNKPEFWAVVVAPWVLIQENSAAAE